MISIFFNDFVECFCNDFRRIFKRAASESAENKHFCTVIYSRLENVLDSAFEQFFQCRLIRIFTSRNVRRGTGDHVYLKPLVFRHQLRNIAIILENRYAFGIDQPVRIKKAAQISVVKIKIGKNTFITKAGIKIAAAAKALFLRHCAVLHTAARIFRICKIQHGNPAQLTKAFCRCKSRTRYDFNLGTFKTRTFCT